MRPRTVATITVVLLALTCAACTRHDRLQLTAHSMEPTLPAGAVVTYDATTAAPTRGQLVVLHQPNGLFVSRVVALPGETVAIQGGVLLVDGRAGADPHPGEPIRYTIAPTTLRADQFFVLGDNRDNAVDSHIFGPVSRSQVLGIVDQ